MLSMINRGRIKDNAVIQEFEHLIARLRGFLSQSFDEDGQLIVADPNLAIFSVGDYKPSAQTDDHAGWLLCDGRQVSRSTYQSLFLVCGTTYGAGDGSTTFNIPDLQGRFLLSKASSGTGSSMGETGGEIDHDHTMGNHSHTVSITTTSGGSHNHTVTASGSADTGNPSSTVEVEGFSPATVPVDVASDTHVHSVTVNVSGNTSSDGAHTHDVSGNTGSTSAGTSGTNNPPFLVGNFFIFTGVA